MHKKHCDHCKKLIKASFETITTKHITYIKEHDGSGVHTYNLNFEQDFCNLDCLTNYINKLKHME